MNTSARELSPSASGRNAYAKFSPVPWTVVDNSWDFSTVYDDNGAVVASVLINHFVTEDSQDRYEPIKEANARLIAAAPDLLAALQAVVLDAYDNPNPGAYTMADAAIAKALGTDPTVSESSGASQVPGPTT